MSLEDKFSLKKIGTGRQFKAGSFSSRTRKGLAGALRSAKFSGYETAANLSQRDLKKFQSLLGDELRQLPSGMESLPRHARLKIMSKAEIMRRQGVISASDKADLRKIVDILGKKEQTNRLTDSEKRTSLHTSSGKNSWQAMGKPKKIEQSPEQIKRMRAYIKMDIADELAAEERGESTTNYRPGSALARYEASQRNRTEKRPATFHDRHPDNKLGDDESETEDKKGGKKAHVDLPDTRTVIDLDIG